MRSKTQEARHKNHDFGNFGLRKADFGGRKMWKLSNSARAKEKGKREKAKKKRNERL